MSGKDDILYLKQDFAARGEDSLAVKNNVKNILIHAAKLRMLALLMVLLVVLALLGTMIIRNLYRIETLRSYLTYSHTMQETGLDLQEVLVNYLSIGNHTLDESKLAELSEQIHRLSQLTDYLDSATPIQLRQLHALLQQASEKLAKEGGPKQELLQAIRLMTNIKDAERNQRGAALEEISSDTRMELIGAAVILTAILFFALFFVQHHILKPLNKLKELLLNLGKQQYTPMLTEGLDPLLLPVFSSYNTLVTNLAALEEANRLHAESLEMEVRTATRDLLEQQHSLATAERLAAVGELAASLAHELRNPLAGIQMSCCNLRDETDNTDHRKRLDLVVAELKRVTRLLNNLLGQSRQIPVPPSDINLAELVHELVAITRYQIPTGIDLNYQISADMQCHLPASSLRQALLNLILNAAQAIDQCPGRIAIVATVDKETLVISVTDDGPGFKEEKLSYYLAPFVTNHPQGTGLGLAIVQRFLREIGGQLKLENIAPHGACVTMLIPNILAA